ncbi:hypothetical protein BC834DRAFT_313111 [Gloeopeniophorella convolvens]|nr:hypothetical protein BC834DRAFT_313111 [Gloeopeniophorella convolvens]
MLYDLPAIGRFFETRDLHLALLAYSKGCCDDRVLELTIRHKLFERQARYVLHRRTLALWAKVLATENAYQKQLVKKVRTRQICGTIRIMDIWSRSLTWLVSMRTRRISPSLSERSSSRSCFTSLSS